MKIWNWLNGNKTWIAVILSVVVSVLGRRGVEIPAWVFDATDGILGLGLAHKAVKAVGPKAATVVVSLLAALALTGCATSPQTADQPATIKPQAELGQGRTSAAAAMYKSAATSEKDASIAPESRAVGAEVSVPFALWNPETKSWQIPLDANGKPYMVTATAVRDFTYVVAGTVSNSATVSGTASGSQTQGGTAGASSGQTATPTTTVSPTTDVSIPVK